MVASVAAGRLGTGRWVLAISPVAAAVVLMVVFGLAAGSAAGSKAATNPSVGVPGLLNAVDAGRGWTATHSGAISAEQTGCFRPRAAMLASAPRSLVGVILVGPVGLPQVDEIAARYATSSGALRAFDSLKVAMSCGTYTTASGVAMVVPLRVRAAADHAAGALATVESGTADFVAVQKGTGLALIVYGSTGTPDAAALNRLTARALQRLGP